MLLIDISIVSFGKNSKISRMTVADTDPLIIHSLSKLCTVCK